jgi:hypothetical protein
MAKLVRRVDIGCQLIRLVRSGVENLDPTGLRKAHPRRGMVVRITAMMQEVGRSCGLRARKSQRGTVRSTEQRAKVGLRKNACEDARGCEILQAFCLGVLVNQRSLERHIRALCCFTGTSGWPAIPKEVCIHRDIAFVTPKKHLCDAHVSGGEGQCDFWLPNRRSTCQFTNET